MHVNQCPLSILKWRLWFNPESSTISLSSIRLLFQWLTVISLVAVRKVYRQQSEAGSVTRLLSSVLLSCVCVCDSGLCVSMFSCEHWTVLFWENLIVVSVVAERAPLHCKQKWTCFHLNFARLLGESTAEYHFLWTLENEASAVKTSSQWTCSRKHHT